MSDDTPCYVTSERCQTQELLHVAVAVSERAYAPYSNFHVGAALRTSDGRIFSGANVENASYSVTSCAETSALSSMASAGYRDIAEIVIVGPGPEGAAPCGRCRQAIREFANADTVIHIGTTDGETSIVDSFTMDELLPRSFGPENLR